MSRSQTRPAPVEYIDVTDDDDNSRAPPPRKPPSFRSVSFDDPTYDSRRIKPTTRHGIDPDNQALNKRYEKLLGKGYSAERKAFESLGRDNADDAIANAFAKIMEKSKKNGYPMTDDTKKKIAKKRVENRPKKQAVSKLQSQMVAQRDIGIGPRPGQLAPFWDPENLKGRYAQRGSLWSVDKFGKTVAEATPEQLQNRIRTGFRGQGAYWDGQGGFFGDVWNGIKKGVRTALPLLEAPATAALNSVAPGLGTALVPLAMTMSGKILGEGEYTVDANGQPVDRVTGEPAMFVSHPTIQRELQAPMPNLPTRVVGNLSTIDPNRVSYNNIVNPSSVNSVTVPTIASVNDETGDLIFSHNEYIGDIISPADGTGFKTIRKIAINPGVAQSFPLLAQFASKFEEYDFVQCVFHLKSLVTDGNATAAGSVMMVPIYNSASRPMPDKRSVASSEGSVTGKITSDLVCGVECDNAKTAYGGRRYVRTVDVDPNGLRLYDIGFLQIATENVPASTPIGELWCSYQVRLSKMRVDTQEITPIGEGITVMNRTTDASRAPNSFPMIGPSALSNISETIKVRALAEDVTAPQNYVSVGGYHVHMGIVGGSVFDVSWTMDMHINLGGDSAWVPNEADIVHFFNEQVPFGQTYSRIDFLNAVTTIPYVVSPAVLTRGPIQTGPSYPLSDPWPTVGTYIIPMTISAKIRFDMPGTIASFDGDVLFSLSEMGVPTLQGGRWMLRDGLGIAGRIGDVRFYPGSMITTSLIRSA